MSGKLFFATIAALVFSSMAVRGDMREVARRAAPCRDLAKETAYGGAGGNAYVVRFKGTCGKVPRGSVAKVFYSLDEQKAALKALGKLPDVKALAGLVQEKKEFDGPCVHVHRDDDCCSHIKPSDTCHFMVMQNGGSKTLQQCVEGQALAPDTLKGLLVSAINAAISFHKLGWYHGDYQLKNLMVNDACSPRTLKAVDLDYMDNKEGTPGESWNKPHHMLRDYAMLLGTCDWGALPLVDFEYKSANVQKEAARIAAATEPIMSPHCNSAWNLSPDEVVEIAQKLKTAVQGA